MATKPEIVVDNLPAVRSRAGGVAAIVPQNWQEVTAIAGAICRARMAPKSYLDQQGNPLPDKVAVAIMHGLEVGFTPMASLQSIAVINGMPSIYGDGLLALIRSSGLLEDLEEFIEYGKDGPISATCKMWRKGEKTPSIQVYTRADAQKARLWGKTGPWTDHPARMLQWRARGWCGRDKFADVLRGLHSAEEMEDMVDVTSRGSASTEPAPPEPKRGDYVPQAGDEQTVPKDQPQPPESHSKGGEDGHPANHPPAGAGGDSTSEAASAPANKVTDVEEIPDEPITFEKYTRVGDFFAFSDPWLQDPKRTPAEAKLWEAFYRDYIAEKANSKSDAVRSGISETIGFYSAILAKEQPE